LPLSFELLVDRGLPAVLRVDELGVDDLLLFPKTVRGGRLLLVNRVEIPKLTRQLVLGTTQVPDGVVVVRIDEIQHLDVARRVGRTRAVEEQDAERAPTALVCRDGAIARDLLELGHSLPLLVDTTLQLGDAGLELPGSLEGIEVRTGDLIHLRLGFRDGLVSLGDGVRLLRERRRPSNDDQRRQQATSNHESGKAPVVHIATATHGSTCLRPGMLRR
jgi:hypothetical protein